MRVTRASIYAVYGMCYLAGQPSGRLVPISEIRRKCGLPEKHLAKIFRQLVRAGLLRSVRGARGGFTLGRPAGTISPLDVIQVIEGSARVLWCPSHPLHRGRSPCCPLTRMVVEGRRQMEAVLREKTLDRLVVPP